MSKDFVEHIGVTSLIRINLTFANRTPDITYDADIFI